MNSGQVDSSVSYKLLLEHGPIVVPSSRITWLIWVKCFCTFGLQSKLDQLERFDPNESELYHEHQSVSTTGITPSWHNRKNGFDMAACWRRSTCKTNQRRERKMKATEETTPLSAKLVLPPRPGIEFALLIRFWRVPHRIKNWLAHVLKCPAHSSISVHLSFWCSILGHVIIYLPRHWCKHFLNDVRHHEKKHFSVYTSMIKHINIINETYHFLYSKPWKLFGETKI